MRVHEIGIAADAKAFDQGIRSGVIKPVENAEKALDELGRARGPEQLERALKDAQKQSERLDDSLGDVGDGGVRNLDRVKGGAQELQQEIGSNLGEAVSSFRGDLSDIGQVGQDTLGGLAATVAGAGPAGLLGAFALAAGAAGLGALVAGQEAATEKQQKLNEEAAKFAQGYIDGIGGALSAAQVFAEIQSITTDPERYAEAKAAEEWGVDVSTAIGALAGDSTALATAQQALTDRTAEANRLLAEQETQVDSTAGEVYDMADSTKAGAERMEALNEALRLGKEQANNAAAALYSYAITAGEATGQTDDLGNAVYRLPDGKEIVVDAATKRAYKDIDALEKQKVTDKTFSVRARLDTSEWDRWQPNPKTGRVNVRGINQVV